MSVEVSGIADVNRILMEIAPREAINLVRATVHDIASQLSKDERVAYCGIPAVQGQLEPGELRDCVDGKRSGDDVPPEAASDPRPIDGLARSALLKAAQFRTQDERDAFCNRQEVRALLTPSQVQECEAGLSPINPADRVLTDDDPGYRDQGH